MTASQNRSRSTPIWIFALVVLAAVSFFAMRRDMGKAMRMTAETTVKASSQQLNPGEQAKAVLEVTTVVPGASIEGNILEKQTETDYKRTSDTMKVAYDAATPVVMGKPVDVHAGAVVHVTAKMGTDHQLHASQIVILTGYVKVH